MRKEKNKKALNIKAFCFGASNGNRTRFESLKTIDAQRFFIFVAYFVSFLPKNTLKIALHLVFDGGFFRGHEVAVDLVDHALRGVSDK